MYLVQYLIITMKENAPVTRKIKTQKKGEEKKKVKMRKVGDSTKLTLLTNLLNLLTKAKRVIT